MPETKTESSPAEESLTQPDPEPDEPPTTEPAPLVGGCSEQDISNGVPGCRVP